MPTSPRSWIPKSSEPTRRMIVPTIMSSRPVVCGFVMACTRASVERKRTTPTAAENTMNAPGRMNTKETMSAIKDQLIISAHRPSCGNAPRIGTR